VSLRRAPASVAPRAPVPPSRLVLLGHPVSHSRSPAMQEAALRAAGRPGRYEALDVPPGGLGDALARLRDEGAAGNVTIPHKEAVAAAAVRRSPVAQRVGAVNTFWHEADGLVGHNTDVAGARAAVAALWSPELEGRPVLLLGAGGAAAALLVALESVPHGGVEVVARSPDRAERLAERTGVRVTVTAAAVAAAVAGATPAQVGRAGLVVNATPIGQREAGEPVPVGWLAPDAAALDPVYAPDGTPWVRACRLAGRRAEDGLRMLVEQGAHAFVRWFGVEPDRTVMWRALQAAGFP